MEGKSILMLWLRLLFSTVSFTMAFSLMIVPYIMYSSSGNESIKDENEPFHFGDEDWERLNKIIGYKEGDDSPSVLIKDKVDVLHTSLNIYMTRSAAKLIDGSNDLAELSCEGLNCLVKLYPETKVFDVKLMSYKLSSPNGLLAEVMLFLIVLKSIIP